MQWLKSYRAHTDKQLGGTADFSVQASVFKFLTIFDPTAIVLATMHIMHIAI